VTDQLAQPLELLETQDQLNENWPMGTVIQEVHTGTCCGSEEPYCDFYEQLWVMQFQMGWMRAGAEHFDENDDEPRLPCRLLWHPSWVVVLGEQPQ
jgi:hypothetical protein